MIEIFSNEKCSLGEGPLWHKQRNSLFWVDINNKKVFEKKIISKNENYDHVWEFEFMVTALAVDLNSSYKLWLITENSLVLMDLPSGSYKIVKSFPIQEIFRTNDAGVAPDGKLWFGTMEKSPTGSNGDIYSIDSGGKLIKRLSNIGIPNTMQWLDTDKFYFSDSLKQKIYLYDPRTQKTKIIVDLTAGLSTPDGGAFSSTRELWNAQWDGGRLACYDDKGKLLQSLVVPVPRPTSCCFGGASMDKLFITSASEGLSNSQIEDFPLSGCLFIAEVKQVGAEIPSFHYREDLC